MSFNKLLEDLEELKKAQAMDDGEGDKAIQAAASDPDNDGDDDGSDEGDTDGDADEQMGKSYRVTDAEGNEVEAMDATEMLKSLQATVTTIGAERAAERETLGKALSVVHDMLKEQGDVIKALGEQVTRMANEGRGRKAVVTVQSGDMNKSETVQMNGEDVLAKCESALKAGKLNSMDVSIAEACINRGMAVPDRILSSI